MNRDDVIDVLSVVAAATRRTVGEMDVEIWGAVIGHLDKQQALKAVQDHLREKPGVWLEPGHIAERVRIYARDAAEKSHTKRVIDEGRAARQLALEQANKDRIAELTEQVGKPFLRPSQSRSNEVNPLSVRCPYEACRSKPGYVCVNTAFPGSKPRREPHPSRVEAAEAAAENAS